MSFTFNLCIGGQQGEGVASMGKILSQSLNEYGYYVFGYRNFSSRIKGGPTSYHLNISDERIEATKEKINLLLALDQQAIDNHTHLLADDGIIIVEELFQAKITSNHFVFTYPFEKKGAELGNKLYGNMMAIGLISKVLSLPLDYISFQVKRLFSNKSETIKNSNLVALNFGYNLPTKIPDLNLTSPNKKEKTILITGNQAVSLGLIGGGCKFMAAYPITPASEIMEYMAENIGSVGGSIIQAEDEISAISMAIGASYSGTRSITATSGPGLSLMGEAISLSGMTETPVVIVNVQRAGPSTGMPTKQEQSDLDAALYSGHGEFPRIVLSPGNPEEAFHDGVLGLNLADIYQCPVIILSDFYLGQSEYSSPIPKYQSISIDRGKIVPQEELDKRDNIPFPRYGYSEDGISPRTLPGQEKGLFYTTGVEHNEIGFTNTTPEVRVKMFNKRMSKLKDVELDNSYIHNNINSHTLLIGYGSSKGVLDKIYSLYKDKENSVDTLQMRILFPFPKKSLIKIFEKYKNIVFIENNYTNQLYNLFRQYLEIKQEVATFNKYDGNLITIDDISNFLERSINNEI